jgi:hypothetical protein
VRGHPHPRSFISDAFRRPHNGKNISLSQLVSGLKVAYNLSTPLCYILSLVGLTACGTLRLVGLTPSWTLDLENLALHNRIEHDASIVHADAAPHAKFAPRDVDPALLKAFIDACPPDGMTKQDFVRVRAKRELTLNKPLNFFRSTLAASEAVSAFDRVSDLQAGTFSKEALQVRWAGFQCILDTNHNGSRLGVVWGEPVSRWVACSR